MHVILEGTVADIRAQPGLRLLTAGGEHASRCFDRINICANFAAYLNRRGRTYAR
jgi:hypothetical protein